MMMVCWSGRRRQQRLAGRLRFNHHREETNGSSPLPWCISAQCSAPVGGGWCLVGGGGMDDDGGTRRRAALAPPPGGARLPSDGACCFCARRRRRRRRLTTTGPAKSDAPPLTQARRRP